MAFAIITTAVDRRADALPEKRPGVQATLETGHYPANSSAIPYDENELRRFLRGGLAAK